MDRQTINASQRLADKGEQLPQQNARRMKIAW
jgi:hypothetical protein